jgi:replicative DNA helicase
MSVRSSQWRDERPQIVEAKSDAGRVPPHDLDAEASVLSAVLLENRAMDRVLPMLRPEQFYSDANRRIFEACVELKSDPPRDENGVPLNLDITTIAGWLRDREWINQIGGSSYLIQLVDATPSVNNVVAHAQIVAEKHRLRQFIGACQQAAAIGYGDIGGTVDQFIGQFEQTVRHLLRSAPGRIQSQNLATIMQTVMAQVSDACQRRASGLAPRELIETRFPRLDAKLAGSGLMRGNLYIIGARPGMGKTALATSLVTQICEPPDINFDPNFQHVEHSAFFWSGEMPREQLTLRLWCADAGVAFTRAKSGELTPDEWQDFTMYGQALAELPIIIEDKPGITVAELEALVREARAEWERPADPSKQQRERRMSVVVVDYLTLMRGTGKEKGREEIVSGISRDLKEMAKRLDIAVIALVQLNRANEARTVKDKRPQLSDIRESGQIEQDGDLVGFIHRPEYYNPTDDTLRGIAELIIAKQRNAPPGLVFFHFNGPRMRFGTPDATMSATIREIYAQGKP